MIIMGARFDWSPHTSSFIIRMPTSTHDIFTELIVREIWSQLENVARGDKEVAAIVDLVRSEATSDVYLYGHGSINNRYPKHPPDASFAHADSQYPFMVSRPHTHSDTKTWPSWLMITYAVPMETLAWYWGSILNTALGLRGHRFPSGDLD